MYLVIGEIFTLPKRCDITVQNKAMTIKIAEKMAKKVARGEK